MTISYNWICEYLPKGEKGTVSENMDPEKLSRILTSIGLEVESIEKYEEVKGGLQGLVIGEVMECEKHPDADRLSVTKVNIDGPELLQIVCGAPNVAKGQKVIVATVGSTIYPYQSEPITMKKAKIRGVESMGMICAEDEIGLNSNHAGILVLPETTLVGTTAAEYFKPYQDYIFEIGLTPNRMDAMSHLGVARDVCAWLSHHTKKETQVVYPYKNASIVTEKKIDKNAAISITIDNPDACQRYAGVLIQDVTIAESPLWLQQKLKCIGLKPINNIVDITNFILHETGQPLHAFDADMIKGKQVIVKTLPEATLFTTLDEKERKLSSEDIMVCNAEEPMCIGGVYGGLHSGVKNTTKNIFLESAWFNPTSIRKTSLKHGLRTDAATRFEKGVDIANTVNVLKRAAHLILEIGGGKISTDLIDIYPAPKEKTEIAVKYHYLKKLSGKNYHADTIKNILTGLGFEILKEGMDDIRVSVPFSKPDITIPADLVEEIMRIDGLDNIEIPSTISISPSVEKLSHEAASKEKAASYLSNQGFNEIFTNSITNAAYYSEATLQTTVRMINSLSAELNIMRPSMMETGLESVAYNLNRKNSDLKFYEFGKTYHTTGAEKYTENEFLSIYITGKTIPDSWKSKSTKVDFYFIKGIFEKVIETLGVKITAYQNDENEKLNSSVLALSNNTPIGSIGIVNNQLLDKFDIKQPVFYAEIHWDKVIAINKKNRIEFTGIPKFPNVQRDLALVVDKSVKFNEIEKATQSVKLNRLKSINLFDIFESDKLGFNKKSMAVSFTFSDKEKTMTDVEIDSMMNKLIDAYQKELNAEIRK